MSKNVGLVGLGKMGLPVALSLLEHGFTVYGYRRHMIDDFITMGGTPVASSKEVAQHSDIVLTCLPSDEALLEAVSGENGLIHGRTFRSSRGRNQYAFNRSKRASVDSASACRCRDAGLSD